MSSSKKKPYRSTLKLLIILAVILPYCIAFTPNPEDTTSTTSLEFALGAGSFTEVSRSCEGSAQRYKVPFADAGVGFTAENDNARLQLRTGVVHELEAPPIDRGAFGSDGAPTRPSHTIVYVNPQAGIGFEYAGMDLGLVYFGGGSVNDQFTGKKRNSVVMSGQFRLGSLNNVCATLGINDNLPIVSGTGTVSLGVGINMGSKRSHLWLGLSSLPYDGALSSVRLEFPVSQTLNLSIKGGGVMNGKSKEYGFAVGGRYYFH